MFTKRNFNKGAAAVSLAAMLLVGAGCVTVDTSEARSSTMSVKSTASESLEGLRQISADAAASVEAKRKEFDAEMDRLKASADKYAQGMKMTEADASAEIDKMINMSASETRGVLPVIIASDDTPVKKAAKKPTKKAAKK